MNPNNLDVGGDLGHPKAPTNCDLTTQQLADRVASAISQFTAATAYRLAHWPHSDVGEAERMAYDALRAALHDMATTEYDRGYRTAIGQNRTPRNIASIIRESADWERRARESDAALREMLGDTNMSPIPDKAHEYVALAMAARLVVGAWDGAVSYQSLDHAIAGLRAALANALAPLPEPSLATPNPSPLVPPSGA